jgi:manganese/iron transport system ATP-binding protein
MNNVVRLITSRDVSRMAAIAGANNDANTNGADGSIAVDGATVVYRNGHVALSEVSFELGSAGICGLIGVNGSGKSTLFKAIMGQVWPLRGEVRVCGMPVAQALRRRLIAYVPQSEDVDWNFPVSVRDVVMMGRYGHMGWLRIASREDHYCVEQAMERLGIAALAGRQIGELSGGQKKRVFLARALAQQGRVILLDEPFTGVDAKTETAITDLMRELRAQGRLMLVSTHHLETVPDFCDRVLLLNRSVIAAGPTASTFTDANLERLFGLARVRPATEHVLDTFPMARKDGSHD